MHTLGLVSNVFTAVLGANASTLAALLASAPANGVLQVELRQGTLGAPYETPAPDWMPQPDALGALARGAPPELALSYAFQMPVMSQPAPAATDASALFAAALAAMQALVAANPRAPRLLRVVDLDTTTANFNASLTPDIAAALRRMSARTAAALSGARLAVENARLAWDATAAVMSAAAPDALWCFDACNTIAFAGDNDATPARAASSLQADPARIALLHAKQSPAAGRVLPTVTAGRLDWADQAGVWNAAGCAAPLLLEVAASTDVWGAVATSAAFLRSAGFNFASAERAA